MIFMISMIIKNNNNLKIKNQIVIFNNGLLLMKTIVYYSIIYNLKMIIYKLSL